MAKIQEYETEFWALLKRLGIDVTNGHQLDIERNVDTLKDLADWPLEWFPQLEATCRTNGVMNVQTVLKYMQVSKARNIPPGERPADQEKAKPVYDDAFIDAYERNQWERYWSHLDRDEIPEPGLPKYDQLVAQYGS